MITKSVVNHHLMKSFPLYFTIQGFTVKLLKAHKDRVGLYFLAEITEGPDRGKYTQINKSDITHKFYNEETLHLFMFFAILYALTDSK